MDRVYCRRGKSLIRLKNGVCVCVRANMCVVVNVKCKIINNQIEVQTCEPNERSI